MGIEYIVFVGVVCLLIILIVVTDDNKEKYIRRFKNYGRTKKTS